MDTLTKGSCRIDPNKNLFYESTQHIDASVACLIKMRSTPHFPASSQEDITNEGWIIGGVRGWANFVFISSAGFTSHLEPCSHVSVQRQKHITREKKGRGHNAVVRHVSCCTGIRSLLNVTANNEQAAAATAASQTSDYVTSRLLVAPETTNEA